MNEYKPYPYDCGKVPLNNKEVGTKNHKFKLVLDECVKIRFCVKSQLVHSYGQYFINKFLGW